MDNARGTLARCREIVERFVEQKNGGDCDLKVEVGILLTQEEAIRGRMNSGWQRLSRS